jgi:N6-L-threonylcarbamoyladenine synthase
MKILAIETSCDETAVALLEVTQKERSTYFKVLGNTLLSQIDIHKEYGGVFPALAKREHAKNLVPVLASTLEEAGMNGRVSSPLSDEQKQFLQNILEREPELFLALSVFAEEITPPDIDVIAVTYGPGLEPALWVGVNFARALSYLWSKPLVGVNHMEGHALSSLAKEKDGAFVIEEAKLPLLALLISGGHTELVCMNEWLSYTLIGQTRDDAVGEAFDKVARMMDLPYPGGPEISKLAERDREDARTNPFDLPRPMIDSDDCDFSFSGLKTAVMYLLKKREALSAVEKEQLARAFEDAVTDVLWKKTARALEQTQAQTLVIGGGVSANIHIQRAFKENMTREFPHVLFSVPPRELTTDNAVMIGIAGYFRAKRNEFVTNISANGNLSLSSIN